MDEVVRCTKRNSHTDVYRLKGPKSRFKSFLIRCRSEPSSFVIVTGVESPPDPSVKGTSERVLSVN